MASGSDVESPVSLPATNTRTWSRLLGLLFGSGATKESVVTRVHIEAAPELLWERILFYEDVPGSPPLLLARILSPIGTKGDKSQLGASIECRYREGSLVKRITIIEEPYSICFDVTQQRLGIENCAITRSGSYRISRSGSGSEIMLTTNYTAFLHPRWLWLPIESLAVHQLHGHILEGIRKMVAAEHRSVRTVTAGYTCRKEET